MIIDKILEIRNNSYKYLFLYIYRLLKLELVGKRIIIDFISYNNKECRKILVFENSLTARTEYNCVRKKICQILDSKDKN